MTKLLALAATISVLGLHVAESFGGDITFSGRNWKTNDPDPANPPTYSGAGGTGTITGVFGPDATIATPITIAVGDTVTYDFTLSNQGSNWVGDAFGDFRGGALVDNTNFTGYLITGRVGYDNDFASDRSLWFHNAGFSADPNSPYPGATEDSPGIRIQWWFPTANTYQARVANIGSGSHVLASFHGSTGGNAVTDIAFFRQDLNDTLQTATISNFTHAPAGAAGSLVFSFEGDATADGFKDLTAPGSATNWASTSATIDIGNSFNLLAATHGADRVVVTPYADRDNFGHANHRSLVLRSPTFQLDGSGSLQVDMLGGMRNGENKSLASLAEADPLHVGELGSKQRNGDFDFGGAGEVDDGKHLQGFALRNALTGEYVLIGSNSATNDGKQRPTDPYARGVWNTAMFTAAQLAPYANDGNLYQIDFFDSFGESSWAHIGFDNLRVPGSLASFQPGDADGNDAVDSNDAQTAFANFTGPRSASPVAKADGLARINGDFDGNGDVDGGDVVEVIANMGLLPPTTGSARLIYDPTDGSIKINAEGASGGVINTFRLTSADGSFLTGVADLPTASPVATDLAGEIFWADTTLAGFSGMHDLGPVLASGLDLAGVQQALTSAQYVGAEGTGAFDFITSIALDGDFNSDGLVDSDDLNDPVLGWKARFGDDLGGSDFLVWQRNLGSGAPAEAAAAAVPEPSTTLLALLGILGGMPFTRRGRVN